MAPFSCLTAFFAQLYIIAGDTCNSYITSTGILNCDLNRIHPEQVGYEVGQGNSECGVANSEQFFRLLFVSAKDLLSHFKICEVQALFNERGRL